jgi:hypothetical protein
MCTVSKLQQHILEYNWNNEMTYQGIARTCSNINAILGTGEEFRNDYCLPREGGNNDGIGDILASNAKSEIIGSESTDDAGVSSSYF